MRQQLIFTFILCTIFASAQMPSFQWARNLGGQSSEGNAITTDGSGNVLSTGFFRGMIDLDPGPGTSIFNSFGVEDIYVSKLDAQGNFLWGCQFGGPYVDEVLDITTDKQGNVFITGNFQGSADFDPTSAQLTFTTNGYDMFIVKLDPMGALVWAKQFEGDNWGKAYSLKTDAAGNLFTVGHFSGKVDFDPGSSIHNEFCFSGADGFIHMLDPLGNFVWVKKYNGGGVIPWGVDLDAMGNIYLAGQYNGTLDADPGPGTFYLNSIQSDVLVSKFDKNGIFIWAVSMGSPHWDLARDLCVDKDKNVLITGSFNQTADFDPGPGTFTIASAGLDDIFVTKLDSLGKFKWAANFGSTTSEHGYGIQADSAGYVYSSGYHSGTVDFDPGPGTYTLLPAGNNQNGYISKLSPAGNFVWTIPIGNTGSERAYDLNVDAAAKIYVTGYFQGTVDFDHGAGTHSLTMGGNLDAFVLKLASCAFPSPPVNTTPAPVICQGQIASLTANSSGTVNWYNAATGGTLIGSGSGYTTGVLTTGMYTFYAEASTCTISTSRTPVTVTVSSNLSASASVNQVCEGGSAVLTASGSTTFSWSHNASGNSVTVTPATTTAYTVTGNNASVCVNMAVLTVSVDACLGVAHYGHMAGRIKLYPNPCTDNFFITAESTGSELKIYDYTGRLVLRQVIKESTTSVRLPDAAGDFYVVVYGDQRIKLLRNGDR